MFSPIVPYNHIARNSPVHVCGPSVVSGVSSSSTGNEIKLYANGRRLVGTLQRAGCYTELHIKVAKAEASMQCNGRDRYARCSAHRPRRRRGRLGSSPFGVEMRNTWGETYGSELRVKASTRVQLRDRCKVGGRVIESARVCVDVT